MHGEMELIDRDAARIESSTDRREFAYERRHLQASRRCKFIERDFEVSLERCIRRDARRILRHGDSDERFLKLLSDFLIKFL